MASMILGAPQPFTQTPPKRANSTGPARLGTDELIFPKRHIPKPTSLALPATAPLAPGRLCLLWFLQPSGTFLTLQAEAAGAVAQE